MQAGSGQTVTASSQPVTHTTWSWRNIYPAGGTCQHVTAAMAAEQRSHPHLVLLYSHWLPQAQNSEPKAVAGRGDAGRDGTSPKCLSARAHMISQVAGAYQCAAHSRRCEGRRWSLGQKRGISEAAGTVNQTCVFIGSDLDAPSRLTPT